MFLSGGDDDGRGLDRVGPRHRVDRAGKLADIVVLDANPLDDIKNTAKTRYIVKNGVEYDAATFDEVWPTARKFPTSVWARDEMDRDSLRIMP